jgi:hypothetical protein
LVWVGSGLGWKTWIGLDWVGLGVGLVGLDLGQVRSGVLECTGMESPDLKYLGLDQQLGAGLGWVGN